MKQQWARIADWLRVHAPDEAGELRPPATNRHINHLEDVTGLRLPDEMEQSYRVHDGSWALWLFPGGGTLMSIRAIEEEWLRWKGLVDEGVFEANQSQPEGPIKPLHWNVKWLPLTDGGSGNHFCADLDPAQGGSVGQMIYFDHEVGPVRVVANGFAEWLSQLASNLESGRYTYRSPSAIVDTLDAP